MVRRTEVQHNSAEQTHAYIAAALALVEELEPPEDLRVAAFSKAVDLLSAKQLILEQPAPIGMPAMAIPRQ